VGGRYRVDGVIGEGSQSVVYAAHFEGSPVDDGQQAALRPRAPRQEVALKVIHRHLSGDPQIARRFQREAMILRRLEGEHVGKMLDFVEDDGLLAIALERVEGVSLEAMLAQHAPLDLDLAVEITLQVCAALGAAHANGIVHRDLKTANVLVSRPTGQGHHPVSARAVHVKVVDFGLSKLLHDGAGIAVTEQGMIFGTPEYMSPEQARGDEVDARADLYAAGVMLYEMLVGAPPFSGRTPIGTMSAHVSEPPRSPRAVRPGSNISPGLEAVMLRALAKDPEARFASARELAQAIAAVRHEPLVIAPRAVDDPELIAIGDTDLHWASPSLSQAKTLRADEVAAVQGREGAIPPVVRLNVVSQVPPSTLPSPVHAMPLAPPAGPPRPPEDKGRVKIPVARPEILDAPTVISGQAPRPAGLVWAIVAIVAAALGVVIGVLVGTR
jgi:serine/threonine-protein kinase